MTEDNPFLSAGTDLARQLRQLNPALNERFRWDDVGNAALFMEVFGRSARYVTDAKVWYVFDGTRWAPDVGDVVVDEALKLLARELQKYALGLDQPLLQQNYGKFVHRWTQRRTRDTILRDARSINPAKAAAFDSEPWVLNVNNGVIDLRTGRARSRKPGDMLSKLAPVTFDPAARCERWEQFIAEVSDGDEDLARFLQRISGLCLTGDTSEECAFVLLGERTRNGKTVFCTTLQTLLGDYAASAEPVTLAARKYANGSAPTEDLARLEGKRLVCLPEPDEEMIFSASRLKSITGGDTIVARRPYQESIEFTPAFKLIFASNSLPHCTDPAVFLSNRLWIIPFRRHFEPNEQDHGLKRFFTQPENLTGILNWALEGLRAYLSEGLNPPQAVLEETARYAEHEGSRPAPTMDSIGLFLDQAMEECFTAEVTSAAAYTAYVDWCERNAYTNASIQRFGRTVKEKFPVVRKRPAKGGEKASVIVGYQLKEA